MVARQNLWCYEDAEVALSARALSWLATALKALDRAGSKEPLVNPKVRATSKETKARIAPYSVIPWASSSLKNLLTKSLQVLNVEKYTIAPRRLAKPCQERLPALPDVMNSKK